MRKTILSILLVCLVVCLANSASAEWRNNDGPLRPRESTAARQAGDTRADIRVDVNMALVPVTVTDDYGRCVLGLSSSNFRVLDGKQPMPIATFSQQDAPVSVGLIFDASRSMRMKFPIARLAPEALYRRLNPSDESFLITFSDRPRLQQEFTSNFGDIVNALGFTNPEGTTSLLDAVYMALSQLRRAHNPRKALVIVSDGGDNHSRYELSEVMHAAIESEVQIFAIGIFDQPNSPEEVEGPKLLKDLCVKTGGVAYVINEPKQLADAMSQIGVTLHNEYVLGFYPPQTSQSGKYRPLEVQLLLPAGAPRLRIAARAGYIAAGR